MGRIAIIGGGQTALLAAHALHQKGYQVRLYSDKSPADFMTKARPTGASFRWKMSLDWERELGLEHWGGIAPESDGVHLTFCPKTGNQLLTMLGRFNDWGLAIDVRLQSATWIRDFELRGGRVEIRDVSVRELDEIAHENDLTIVATGGRGALAKLFPRNESRCAYSKPQRHLGMIVVVGVADVLPYAPWYFPVKFNILETEGEAFWVRWYSKGLQKCWSLLFEAKEGSAFDRFREIKTAQDMVIRAREVIKAVCPWDYEWFKDAEPCDENAWLVGSITSEVRDVVGTLPSGKHVIALGDTAMHLDPIGGQGANNGNKMARNLVECTVVRTDQPFDADWMRATFERFWQRNRYANMLNNLLLEPLPGAGKLLLISQYGSTGKPDDTSPQQKLANIFCENFNDPSLYTEALQDKAKAKQLIREAFGSTFLPLARGGLGILQGQIRQAFGMSPGHPGT
jgi:2-polyprenyl-6-methoxyphenol hydroxylase-like FAD-dependent oxidoreductase